ncbi:DUF3886 domain-containing protein [Aquibacillus saliphilus]|uniref:DUF3886 domain-containing protein n=1 Tax=Aquibacillus saliphilus TaxID=1909422 RepID=UPI001CF026E4|nr:DUF3886 domain-containing protein [Aquibacillus saliphilus]
MNKKNQNEKNMVQDRLNDQLFNKLKEKKLALKKQEIQAEQNEKKRLIEEQKKKEKAKSFEELLEGSNQDWQNYK